MDIEVYFKEKLSKILFLEVKKEKIEDIFNIKLNENIYMPLKVENIAEKIDNKDILDRIPMSLFIEGMAYVLGADEKFKYNVYYEKMLSSKQENIKFIKGKIAQHVKERKYEDSYILMKCISKVEKNRENYKKMFLLCDKLKSLSKMYKDEEIKLIKICKKYDDNFPEPYFYESLIYKEEGDFQKSYFCINEYLKRGGKETKEITEFKNSLKIINSYDKGKELAIEDPETALKILIPLLDELGDNADIHYYIALAYRNLENHIKSIYYLNNALAIDNVLIEAVNEMGINYAALGDYDKAVQYFREAFKSTGAIEICTNIIMCYLNMNDLESAKVHLKIAEGIDKDDEIVKELKNILS